MANDDDELKLFESKLVGGGAPKASGNAPAAPSPVQQGSGGNDFEGRIVQPKPKASPAANFPADPIADFSEYEKMPWFTGDNSVYSKAKESFGPSAKNVYAGLYETIANPYQTVANIGQLGKGAYSKVQGALGTEQDPKQKAKEEELINALGEHYSQYFKPGGIKHALATDPAGALMDLSLPATGGEAAVARIPMVGGTIAKGLNIASKANPISAPIEAAKPLLNLGAKAIGSGSSLATGMPKSAVPRAFEAGQEGNTSFLKGITGIADDARVWDTADSAFDKLQKAKSDAYVGSTQGMREMTQKLKYDKVNDAFNEARKDMMGYGMSKNDAGLQYLNDIENHIGSKYMNSPHQMAHTPGFFDFMKQDLYNTFGDKAPNPAAQRAFNNIYGSVKGTIQEAAPGYADAMMQYQDMNAEVKRLLRQAKMGSPNDRQAAVAELLSKRADNRGLIERLSEVEPELKYLVAGKQMGSFVPQGLASSAMYFKPTALPLSIPAVYGYGAYGTGAALTATERALLPSMYTENEAQRAKKEMQGRQGRASGGKVDHKSAEAISDQLVSAFANAKKNEDLESKVLLNKPDDVIIDALKEAKKAI